MRKQEGVTIRELAKRAGLSPTQVHRLAQRNVLPRLPNGRLDGAVCLRILAERKHKKLQPPADEGMTYSEAERRKLAAQAQATEFKLAQLRGETISIEEHTRRLTAIIVAARTRLLVIPPKLAQRLHGVEKKGEILAIAEAEIYAALRELGGERG